MLRVTGLLIVCLIGGSEVSAATRVALVVGGGGQEVRAAIDLTTVRLSAVQGVELLERASIDRVLTEQKLTLAGLADAGQAVTAGKLLSADILAVVEIAPDGKGALGVVVFDAKTGLRLWDSAISTGGADKQADGVSDGIKAALKKHAADRDGLRTVGFVAVRNADLPRPMDSFCDSLAQLVERRLVAADSVGVLERQRLEAITGERALPTQAAEKELLGALVHLDLEVRRGPQGEGLRATVLLTDARGKQLGKFTSIVKESDQPAGADALAKGICETLKATPAAGAGDPIREGARFHREGVQLWSFKQEARALRAAESAYALNPSDPAARILLAQYLIVSGGDHLSPARSAPLRIVAKPDAIAAAAGLVRRGIDQRALALSSMPVKNLRTLYSHAYTHIGIDNELGIALGKFAALDTRRLDAESRNHLKEVGAAVEQWLCNEYLETLAVASEREPVLFEQYTNTLVSRSSYLRLSALDAQHFTRKLIAITERWLTVAEKATPAQMGISAPSYLWMMLTQSTQRLGHQVRWSPGPRELELLDGLFDKMEKHKNVLIRQQGRCGHLWVGLMNRTLTPEECRKGYYKAKEEVLQVINDQRTPAPRELVLGYYVQVIQFYLGDPFALREGGKQLLEGYEVWDGMLTNNVLLDKVLRVAPFLSDASVKPARTLALMNRTLELLDNPRIPYYDGDRLRMKGDLLLARANLIAANPELAGKAVNLPWESALAVLDVVDLPGITEFRMPTVAGDQVFVVGLGGPPNREFLQVFRVPLAGGPPRALGRVSIPTRPDIRRKSVSAIPDKITGVQVGARHVFVASATAGFFAFPLDGGPVRAISEGKNLPSEAVESMVLHNERVYAGLDGGYLISLSPETGKFDVLASSRRREKASPFDDGESFTVPYLAADAERQRLIFILQQGRTEQKGANGFWSWDLKTHDFKRLLEIGGSEWALGGTPIRDGRVQLFSGRIAVDFDLASDKHVLLWGWGDPHGPVLLPSNALCQEAFRGHPRVFRDGWVWAEGPFNRFSISEKKQEFLPTPSRKGNAAVGDTNVIVWVDKDRLLFGSSSVLWLLTLKK